MRCKGKITTWHDEKGFGFITLFDGSKQGRPCAASATLAGGWPGALIAQQLLRHKSKKASFVTVLWGTVLINGGFLFWLHTKNGQVALEAFLR